MGKARQLTPTLLFRIQGKPISKCVTFIGIALLAISQHSDSDPWVSPGDSRTRHHIQTLSDSGKIKLPTTTWPMMWSGISKALDSIRVESLSGQELWSYKYLNHELQRARKTSSTEKKLYVSSSHIAVTNFSSESREKSISSVSTSIVTDNFAFKLQGSAVESTDGDNYHFDGSYGAVNLGNWVYGVGTIDRWWGPSWQNGLILSNNARPTPGLFLQRNESKASSWPLFELLGPWNLTLFANQLEEERHVPNAKLLGGRINFRPLNSFELGISRTAQWGGDKREESARSLWRVISGQDNAGENVSPENEPGNQMGGYDFRYNFNLLGTQWGIYHEKIGEDEKDHLPSQFIVSWGLESAFSTGNTLHRIIAEYSDTATSAINKTPPKGNIIYEHSSIYKSGYRHKGRSIGSSLDNDSIMHSIMGFHEFRNGHSVNWTIANIEFNRDDSNRALPGGSSYETNLEATDYFSVHYGLPLTKAIHAQLGGTFYSSPVVYNSRKIESNLNFAINVRF